MVADQSEYARLPENGKHEKAAKSSTELACACVKRRIPILRWLPEYELQDLTVDVSGGITLGLMCLAQTLAQAAIATTLPISGPCCAFVPPIIYAMLGTSKHASVSSGAMGCIIIASVLDPNLSVEARTELATLLALIAGLFQILMGACNLAFAVRFLSQATISGFVSGGAFLIMASQLKNLFGFSQTPPDVVHALTGKWFHIGAIGKLINHVLHYRHTNLINFIFCIFLLVVLDMCKRIRVYAKTKLKANPESIMWKAAEKLSEMKEIIVIVIGISFAYLTTTSDGEAILPTVGHIPSGLPAFKPPFGEETQKLFNGPAADLQGFIVSGAMIAFTSFLTTYASNKKIALACGYDLDASQELFAIGTASAVGSFFGAFLVCGSLSRTALAVQMGTKSQICSLVVAGVIACCLLFLAPVLYYLPKAALASIVLTSAYGLIDLKTPRDIWNSSTEAFKDSLRKDFIVWCVGFCITILFGALWGICIAVAVGVAQVVAEATAPRAATLGLVASLGGQMRNVKVWPEAKTDPEVVVFEFRGPLCFCSAEGFHEELMSRVDEDVRSIILAFGAIEYVDFSGLAVLKELLAYFREVDIDCIVAGAKHNVETILKEKLGSGQKPLLEVFDAMSVEEAVAIVTLRKQQTPLKKRTRSFTVNNLQSLRKVAPLGLVSHGQSMGNLQNAA